MIRTTQRITLHPGESVEIVLVDVLCNGYPDENGSIQVNWQERDAPADEIAKVGRELQIETHYQRIGAGPMVVTHR